MSYEVSQSFLDCPCSYDWYHTNSNTVFTSSDFSNKFGSCGTPQGFNGFVEVLKNYKKNSHQP